MIDPVLVMIVKKIEALKRATYTGRLVIEFHDGHIARKIEQRMIEKVE